MKLKHHRLRPAKPWQRRRPRLFPSEVTIMDQTPLAQIAIYETAVILTRRRANGSWTSYPISPDALIQVLGKLPSSTGLLPDGIIATGMRDGAPFFVQHVPARIATIQVDDIRTLTRIIPLPALIWAGWRTDYRIFALADDLTTNARLYRAPFPNTYATGGICWGSVAARREASPTLLPAMLRLFLEESQFNSHLASGKSRKQEANILQLYPTLEKEKVYPVKDLVATNMSLYHLVTGAIWALNT